MNLELNNLIKSLSIFSDKVATDCLKIDHYSWPEDSIYRYFEKEFINNRLIREAEIAVENEFLRWNDEASKRFMIEGLGLIHLDRNIPSSKAWGDVHTFERAAIGYLQSLIRDNLDSNIVNIVNKAELHLQEARNKDDIRLTQIYERILYELNECSLREFNELKKTIFGDDNK